MICMSEGEFINGIVVIGWGIYYCLVFIGDKLRVGSCMICFLEKICLGICGGNLIFV